MQYHIAMLRMGRMPAFLLLALLPLLSACAGHTSNATQHLRAMPTTTWPMYQYRSTHNAVFTGTLNVRWTFAAAGKINGGLAIVGDTLYFDSFDRHLYALNVRTGRLKWKAALKNIAMTTPIVRDGKIVVGSGDNNFLEDDTKKIIWGSPGGDAVAAFTAANGKRAWSFPTIGEDMPSSAFYKNRIVFANGDMHAYGVALKSGRLLWKTAMPGVSTMASAAISGHSAFFVAGMGTSAQYDPATNDHTVAIDVRTGHVKWVSPYGSPDCSPTIADGLVFVEDNANLRSATDPNPYAGNNQVVALDQRTGKRVWEYRSRSGFYTSVGTSERAVAATYVNGALYDSIPALDQLVAFAAHTGRVLWAVDTLGPVKMSPVVLGRYLYVGDTAGIFYTINVTNGKVVHAHAFTAPFSSSSPVIVGQTVFFANGKNLFAIPLSDFAPDSDLPAGVR